MLSKKELDAKKKEAKRIGQKAAQRNWQMDATKCPYCQMPIDSVKKHSKRVGFVAHKKVLNQDGQIEVQYQCTRCHNRWHVTYAHVAVKFDEFNNRHGVAWNEWADEDE